MLVAAILTGSAFGQEAVMRSQTADMLGIHAMADGLEHDMTVGIQETINDAEKAAYAATVAASGEMYSEIQAVKLEVAVGMADLNAQMDTITAVMGGQMSQAIVTATDQMSTMAYMQGQSLSRTTAALTATISQAVAADTARANVFTASVSTRIAAVTQTLATATSCSGMGKFLNTTTGQCVEFASMVLGRSAGASCSVLGAIRINSAINRVEVCASNKWWAPMPRVTNWMTHGGEGCENCWINRQIVFTKQLADTYIRILWTDVGRSHGWGSTWNRYHIRICDSGGGNCGDCQDPGHLRTNRHMNQWHGWWCDHYMPMASSGLCRRRNNSNMGAGSYRIRIWCDGGDNQLGWSGSQANLQVDEVYKA